MQALTRNKPPTSQTNLLQSQSQPNCSTRTSSNYHSFENFIAHKDPLELLIDKIDLAYKELQTNLSKERPSFQNNSALDNSLQDNKLKVGSQIAVLAGFFLLGISRFMSSSENPLFGLGMVVGGSGWIMQLIINNPKKIKAKDPLSQIEPIIRMEIASDQLLNLKNTLSEIKKLSDQKNYNFVLEHIHCNLLSKINLPCTHQAVSRQQLRKSQNSISSSSSLEIHLKRQEWWNSVIERGTFIFEEIMNIDNQYQLDLVKFGIKNSHSYVDLTNTTEVV